VVVCRLSRRLTYCNAMRSRWIASDLDAVDLARVSIYGMGLIGGHRYFLIFDQNRHFTGECPGNTK